MLDVVHDEEREEIVGVSVPCAKRALQACAACDASEGNITFSRTQRIHVFKLSSTTLL